MDTQYLGSDTSYSVERVVIGEDRSTVWMQVSSSRVEAICPYCGQHAVRVHSHYDRQPQDIPNGARTVRLQVRVRRFFCTNPACEKQVFSERFPDLVAPYARRTDRLSQLLQTFSLLVGCSVCVELMRCMAVVSSRRSIGRLLRRLVPEACPTPTVLGIDDWALRRGHRYGTVLVDLEQGYIVDLLPDRDADTVANWLTWHPGVAIISRDRAGAYAEGARRGAPEAIQVADRWHLLKNLGEALALMFGRHRAALKQLTVPRPAETDCTPSATVPQSLPSPAAQRRTERMLQVRQWQAEGLTLNAISVRSRLDRKTVRKYLNPATRLDGPVPRRRKSKLTPYIAYLRAHADDGEHTVRQLFRAIQAQGFTGSLSIVAAFMATVHLPAALPTLFSEDTPAARGAPPAPLNPRRATWLVLSRSEQLTPSQHALTLQILHLNPEVAQFSALAQAFIQMVRQHAVDALPAWLSEALATPIRELHTFARGVQRDYPAVQAALALPWSNGPVEAFVNRLKFIKRQMFGRANFDLLRIRVLLQPPRPLQQKRL